MQTKLQKTIHTMCRPNWCSQAMTQNLQACLAEVARVHEYIVSNPYKMKKCCELLSRVLTFKTSKHLDCCGSCKSWTLQFFWEVEQARGMVGNPHVMNWRLQKKITCTTNKSKKSACTNCTNCTKPKEETNRDILYVYGYIHQQLTYLLNLMRASTAQGHRAFPWPDETC